MLAEMVEVAANKLVLRPHQLNEAWHRKAEHQCHEKIVMSEQCHESLTSA